MTRPPRTKRPDAALARLLSVLARQSGALEIAAEPEGSAVTAGAVSAEVLAIAARSGLIATEAGKHRILPAGLAWLKRRLAGGDGFQEQHRACGVREIDVGGLRRRVLVNELESPLSWLRQRKDKDGRPILSDAQFGAGERLRSDFHHAGLAPRVTSTWDGLAATGRTRRAGPGDAQSLRDSVLGARQRLRRALDAVGPELAGVLVDVCCHLKGLEAAEDARGWPARSGKVVLLLALSRLARHYGLIAPEASALPGPSRITHWGDTDYRPTLEAWEGTAGPVAVGE
jgi:hypothetical protein